MLVEAVLAATVIAVGLVFVSRGFANQLHALRTMDEYETLLALAREQLVTLETLRLRPTDTLPPEEEAAGVLTASSDQDPHYAWTAAAVHREDLDVQPQQTPRFSEITITVRRTEEPDGSSAESQTSSAVTLSAIWPTTWVPVSWLQ